MVVLSGKRVVPYVAAGLLVAAVGLWGLKHGVTGEGEPVASLVTAVPGTIDGQGAGAGGIGAAAGGAGGGPAVGGEQEQATTTSMPKLFVQVAGAVARPGVYEVEPGARVFQVLLLAGGTTADADEGAVPLAAVVADGGRIWVPRVGEVPEGGATGVPPGIVDADTRGSSGGQGAPAGPVVLSTADEAELDTLPGVGPKTAQQIVAYREEHGPFRSVEQLEDVPGIGPATVERLRDLVVP